MRILIADDHELIRRGVRSLLQNRPDFNVCGEAEDGVTAIEKALRLQPDLILMDIGMPHMNGLDATREIHKHLPQIDVLVLSQHDSPEIMRQALQAGARGYVVKSSIASDLIQGIETMRRGELFFETSPQHSQPPAGGELRLPEELQHSEERFGLSLNQTAAGIAHISEEGRWLRFNQKVCDISGYSGEELRRLRLQDLTYPEDLKAVEEQAAAVIRGEIPRYSLELRCIRKDGSPVWVNLTAAAARDAQHNFKYFVVTVEDIQARKEAELTANLLAAIVDSSDDAIISTNLDGIITSWNKGAERIFGYSAEQAIGKPMTIIIPHDRRAEEAEILARLRRGERIDHFETVRSTKDGALLHVSLTISPVKDASGRIVGASNVSRDITERKRRDEALTQSESQLAAEARALAKLNDLSSRLWRIQCLEDGLQEMLAAVIELLGADKGNIHILDPKSGILRIAAHRGFSQDFLDFFHEIRPGDRTVSGRALASGQPVVVEDIETDEAYAPFREVARRAGYRAMVAVPMIGTSGQPLAVMATHFSGVHRPTDQEMRRLNLYARQAADFIQRARTEETLRQNEERLRAMAQSLDAEVRARTKELEERNNQVLQQAQKLRELSWALLRTEDEERRRISRELHDSAGQTLAVISMGLSQLIEAAKSKAPELAQQAEETRSFVQQLSSEIRTASYLLHPPLLDESGLGPALSWYIRGLSERSGLKISLHISDDFGRLSRDLELVIFRLVQEALTNIHRHSGSPTASICLRRQGQHVTVEVKDQGKGIAPDRLAEIQSSGSGVGIQGMRERLRQFRGEMNIQSDCSGTTVTAIIPVSGNAQTQAAV